MNPISETVNVPAHRTIDGVVDGTYTTPERGLKEEFVAFVRRRGKAFYLVHNVRKQGKVEQLHLAKLGGRPRITDDVVRRVAREHPFLELDWTALRERINAPVELFDIRSPYVQTLVQSLRILNLDLADLSPPMLAVGRDESSRELLTQLRMLRSIIDVKLSQIERTQTNRFGPNRRFR